MQFIHDYWGDLVALMLLFTGLGVLLLSSLYGLDGGLQEAGNGLIGSALLALKLRHKKS